MNNYSSNFAPFNDAVVSRRVNLWFDGLCEPINPGGTATSGWVITDGQGIIISSGYGVVASGPSATNNLAEWTALELALAWLRDNMSVAGNALMIVGDSLLVVNQLTGRWACRAPQLQHIRSRCHELLNAINAGRWDANWVPQEQNAVADALARRAYEEATSPAFRERHR